MNTRGRAIVCWLIILLAAQMLAGCSAPPGILPENIPSPSPVPPTPFPTITPSPNPDYGLAQATIDTGQRLLSELSQKATQVSIAMAQTADAAARATQEYVQRQKADFDSQSAAISQNINNAAATQEFLKQQTKIAQGATDTAATSAVAATQSAFVFNMTQTAQAQVMIGVWLQQTNQAAAARTAYPETETPLAETQAAMLLQKQDEEEQSFVDRVIFPLIPIVVIVNVLLAFVGIFLAWRWYSPKSTSVISPRNPEEDDSPGFTVDRGDVAPPPRPRQRIPNESPKDNSYWNNR